MHFLAPIRTDLTGERVDGFDRNAWSNPSGIGKRCLGHGIFRCTLPVGTSIPASASPPLKPYNYPQHDQETDEWYQSRFVKMTAQ